MGFQPMDACIQAHRRSRYSKSETISLSQLEDRSALAYSIGVPIDIASTQFMGKMPMLLNKLINPSKSQHLM